MLKGSIVALVTPFHEDGTVNFEKLGELLDWQIENSTDGILILGTSGESSTMTHEEDDAVALYTIERVNHRVPVIVGAGSNCTQTALEKSLKYQNMGADALLLISPYYNKANTQGMIRHFTTVANAVQIPIILYNVPGRTGCHIDEEAVKVLSKHPNICGIKEASGNISYATNIARYLSDDFVMYSGNDDMITSMMALGASGVISVLANCLPKETHEIVQDYLDGNVKESFFTIAHKDNLQYSTDGKYIYGDNCVQVTRKDAEKQIITVYDLNMNEIDSYVPPEFENKVCNNINPQDNEYFIFESVDDNGERILAMADKSQLGSIGGETIKFTKLCKLKWAEKKDSNYYVEGQARVE